MVSLKKISNYPRPQFVRDNWLNLNGEWNFLFDDDDIGEKEQFYKKFPNSIKINVPFTYETKKSGINDETAHKNIWYQKDIDINKLLDYSIIIHFEGSDFLTKLWINGNYVGMNVGGYHRFSFDITNFLVEGKNNFTIKVEDSLSKSQPRGKQRYKKESWKCWYIQTTGIWKTIWLENVSQKHILSSKIISDFDDGSVELELLTNVNEDDIIFELEAEILYHDEKINSIRLPIENDVIKYKIDICNEKSNHEIKYWSPEHPNLYDIVYRLYYNNILIDEVYSYFGMRKISIDKDKILLNNKEIYLRMVLEQGYWQDTHLTVPNEEAIINDINLTKKYGFNGIRIHQKVEDERFLYYCDINGILVWSEMANCYEFNNKSIEYFMDEWIKVVKQNYNHPSIITWVPINESWGVPNVFANKNEQSFINSLYFITKSIDDTRPVITNDGWEHTISDIITIHDYNQDGKILYNTYNNKKLELLNNRFEVNGKHKIFSNNYKYKGQPIIISEYGGISLCSDNGWGYGKQVKDDNEFIQRYTELTNAIKNIKYVSGYCYTQLCDIQQETNGFVDENRNDKLSDEIINRVNKINQDKNNE